MNPTVTVARIIMVRKDVWGFIGRTNTISGRLAFVVHGLVSYLLLQDS
jgi:hypothetical protein